ncbi:hypothetical protein CAOG_06573 [Capsaspora owczarzaki ATCC 30864]|uniref:Nucleotidyl transferase domain-containing protein n=1 Tax=Capsaspora owczarzaki (strain ATCC 30864) TaxID=595528 RepID=A0A0D2WVI9_CAPO3|nr:hypothetical protein CAOG_06573 [Capsaspora owczarzaki ATCC 30864]KJE96218.1 hypothetical protein CAOG_006573 [Capsaspora owczarzaki ATCC 30864]|eukprot:XP_004345322.1 hypothetical protein CAOG_06573 [Capsaspora owczarzaki ATCC 30864]
MNIIIPMGGIGSRFERANYRFPKPLINMVGHPMLFWLLDKLSIDVAGGDKVWMAVMNSLDESFHFTKRIHKQYPKWKAANAVEVVTLDFETRGAAETVFIVLQHMSPADLARPTICLDCDTLYFSDVLADFRRLNGAAAGNGSGGGAQQQQGVNASFYFEDKVGKPVFSYIALDDDKRITDIKEKVAISRWANTGAYGFASGAVLKKYCIKQLDTSVDATGEYYTSSIIKLMLDNKEDFRGIFVPDFACVGTPAQLADFLILVREGLYQCPRKMKFCFDLDNTLVTYPLIEGDYTSCQPMPKNIQLLRELKAAGHYIIIATARRMKTHKGNIGAVINDIGALTLNQLKQFGIPSDEVHFGKPHADVYVDDLAVNAHTDTEKDIGWALASPGGLNSQAGLVTAAVPAYRLNNIVQPRSFNKLTFHDTAVLKASHPDFISGERFFYEHIPADLASSFPKLLEVQTDSDSHVVTLKLEYVKAATYSHLSVNRCVTEGRLLKLLKTLRALHSSAGAPEGRPAPNTLDLYCYTSAAKLRATQTKHSELWATLAGKNVVDAMFDKVAAAQEAYQAGKHAAYAHVVHGDPVFSNVLLKSDGTLILIDMRGQLGATLTLQGDSNADLAKVYQCLWGYDFCFLGHDVTAGDESTLADLRQIFLAYVKEHYPTAADERALAHLAAFNMLQTIPQHTELAHQRALFERACTIIAHAATL